MTGCVGNLSRENFYKFSPDAVLNLGFIMTLGYSDLLERAVIGSLVLPEARMKLKAGIAACSLWSRGIFEGMTKVIAVAADEPFFDSTGYLKAFAGFLDEMRHAKGSPNSSYYAEKFGYDRFFVQWETDNPTDIAVSQAIADFEYDSTRDIVGGGTTDEFPPFMGATISSMNIHAAEELP